MEEEHKQPVLDPDLKKAAREAAKLAKKLLKKTKIEAKVEKAKALQEEEVKEPKKSLKPKKDSEVEISKLKFAQIGQSMVTLWHRPGIGDIKLLKELQGIGLVITLQSSKEHPASIFKECA